MDRIGHLPYTHLFSKHGYGYTDIDMVQQGKLISVSATDVDVNRIISDISLSVCTPTSIVFSYPHFSRSQRRG